MTDLVRRVWLCVRVAGIVTAALVAWLTVVTVAGDGAAPQRYGVTYAQAAAMYVFGGLAAGLIAGVLLPLARVRVGAILVGVLGVLPFCLSYAWVTQGEIAMTWDWFALPLIGAAGFGGGLGWFVWRGLRRAPDRG